MTFLAQPPRGSAPLAVAGLQAAQVQRSGGVGGQRRRRRARRADRARRHDRCEARRLDDRPSRARSSRPRPCELHHARKPPLNASPAPIVSTTSTATGATVDRRRAGRHDRRAGRARASAARPAGPWSSSARAASQRAARPDRQPGEVLLADLDEVGTSAARAPGARGRRRRASMTHGRQFGSTTTIVRPARRATTASSAAASGSSTRPSVPTCSAATSGGSAASAAAGVRPGAAVPAA